MQIIIMIIFNYVYVVINIMINKFSSNSVTIQTLYVYVYYIVHLRALNVANQNHKH